ncbi:MAG: hypothetical protein ACM3TN_28770 [Alphaproteobacteria bacterium]
MPTLELTTAEASLLKEILKTDLGDLRMEISDTDLKSFRDKLKDKEEMIKQLIERLGSD